MSAAIDPEWRESSMGLLGFWPHGCSSQISACQVFRVHGLEVGGCQNYVPKKGQGSEKGPEF